MQQILRIWKRASEKSPFYVNADDLKKQSCESKVTMLYGENLEKLRQHTLEQKDTMR